MVIQLQAEQALPPAMRVWLYALSMVVIKPYSYWVVGLTELPPSCSSSRAALPIMMPLAAK